MAAIHLANAVGGNVFLGFISAVAFATILAVVAGLTLSGASAVSHDLYATVVKNGNADSASELRVSRITTLAEHWNKVGERLGRTVEAYNKSTGSLETSVLRSARKLRDLKVSADDLEITELDQVEKLPRMLQAGEFDRQVQGEEAW
jgi:hypothetical protein